MRLRKTDQGDLLEDYLVDICPLCDRCTIIDDGRGIANLISIVYWLQTKPQPTSKSTSSAMDLPLGWQSFYMVSMFFGTFISYMAPILLIRRQQSQTDSSSLVANRQTYRILSVCNCLSAGLFLGICFLNLIPYVEQEFADIFRETKVETSFPVGMCSVIAGLFLVLTLETLVTNCRTSGDIIPVLQLDEEEDSIVSNNSMMNILSTLLPFTAGQPSRRTKTRALRTDA